MRSLFFVEKALSTEIASQVESRQEQPRDFSTKSRRDRQVFSIGTSLSPRLDHLRGDDSPNSPPGKNLPTR